MGKRRKNRGFRCKKFQQHLKVANVIQIMGKTNEETANEVQTNVPQNLPQVQPSTSYQIDDLTQDEAPNSISEALSSVPSELKSVIENKFKQLNMIKKPIIMPSTKVETDPVSIPKLNLTVIPTNQENDEAPNSISEALSSVPSEIKSVVENKFKQLNMIKKPIIMPTTKVETDPVSIPKLNLTVIPTNREKVLKTVTLPEKSIPVVQNRAAIVKTVITDKPKPTPQPMTTIPYGNYKFPAGIPKTFMNQPNYQQYRPPNFTTGLDLQNRNAQSVPQMNSGVQGGTSPYMQMQTTEPKWSPNRLPNDMESNVTVPVPQEPMDCGQGPSELNVSVGSPPGRRVSAFKRLGSVTVPKRPKLTINLLFSKDEAVREVDNPSTAEMENEPVHRRRDVMESRDELVEKLLPSWPWTRKITFTNMTSKYRLNKDITKRDLDFFDEVYSKPNVWFKVTVTGYPKHYKKEDVLDILLDFVKDKNFIPCFIEFSAASCAFLVLRSRAGLLQLHRAGLRAGALALAVHESSASLAQLELLPRLELRRRLARLAAASRASASASASASARPALDLAAFCAASDVSCFIYFPLSRIINQTELFSLDNTIVWHNLVELNLSNNRLTSIKGFNLATTTPKLHVLDLSMNRLKTFGELIDISSLMLRSLKVEGNPLCRDYIDPDHYVTVARMLFPTLTRLDGVQINKTHELPIIKKNYCPDDARVIVEKFLEIFFPLLELAPSERMQIADLYDEDATMSITFKNKLHHVPQYRYIRELFSKSRDFGAGDIDCLESGPAIARHLCSWPDLLHDPYTFTVDVMYHNEYSTVIRIDGIMKLTSDSLADDEPIVSFSRTIVLHSNDTVKYHICNELIYWDIPSKEYGDTAFKVVALKPSRIALKLDTAPDNDLKAKLIDIFMDITKSDRKISERCLNMKNWDLRLGLEYFIKLLKLNSLHMLGRDDI